MEEICRVRIGVRGGPEHPCPLQLCHPPNTLPAPNSVDMRSKEASAGGWGSEQVLEEGGLP